MLSWPDAILKGCATLGAMWGAVVAAYLKAGLTEADALTQARVARILRTGDYDKHRKEILLWHSTTPVRIPVIELRPAT